MLKPFYQGKLDVFCALYAVLNGLRLTHSIRTGKARELLNDTLYGIAANPPVFRAMLDQKTDYVAIVDAMLAMVKKKYPLEVKEPFPAEKPTALDTFWQVSCDWLNPGGAPAQNRAIICRFQRFLPNATEPVVRHWTTIDSMDAERLHLFDSSHEAETIQNLRKESIVARKEHIDAEHLLYMQPECARFLRLPF